MHRTTRVVRDHLGVERPLRRPERVEGGVGDLLEQRSFGEAGDPFDLRVAFAPDLVARVPVGTHPQAQAERPRSSATVGGADERVERHGGVWARIRRVDPTDDRHPRPRDGFLGHHPVTTDSIDSTSSRAFVEAGDAGGR
jgi:hypothetical protein